MVNIISRLDRQRFAPAVAVLKRGGKLERELEAAGVPVLTAPFTVPPRPYWSLPLRAWRAAGHFRTHRFPLWHSFHYSSDYTEPIIARLAGARAWVFTKKNMGWGSRAWSVRARLATRIAAQNTDMVAGFFASRRLRHKVRLVPRGVDHRRFHPEAPARLGLRSSLGIGAEELVVACVAHLLPVKGQITLVQAMAEAPPTTVWLAGAPLDETYAAQVAAAAAALPLGRSVHLLGEVEDVPALLVEADVFVLPTWRRWRMEGCPVALLEAMASGKACVATDVPGSRDLVVDGESGLLVAPEEPEALSAALRRLATSPELRRRLGQKARRRVEAHYTLEVEVARHQALYAEALGHKG